MSKRGKRYEEIAKAVDREKLYTPAEAVELVKKMATAKFDETIEVAMKLGVDPRHADQQVRGTVVLPNGTGKSVRVAVFAKGEHAQEAEAAGPISSVQKIWWRRCRTGSWISMYRWQHRHDGNGRRLGRVLGPRGLMPNPKAVL